MNKKNNDDFLLNTSITEQSFENKDIKLKDSDDISSEDKKKMIAGIEKSNKEMIDIIEKFMEKKSDLNDQDLVKYDDSCNESDARESCDSLESSLVESFCQSLLVDTLADRYKKFFGQSVTLKFKGDDLTIHFNGLALQSNASVLVTYKLVSILCTLDLEDNSDEYTDFTQLTVHFLTKGYAFSKIPGGPSKRENKSTERDVLLSRLIDRSIRPMISKSFQQPMQLICTLLSCHTTITPTDIDVEFLAVLGSVAAFQLSSIPMIHMPLGVRIGMKGENLLFCPYIQELQKSPLDLFLSFANDSVIMIECEAQNISNEKLVEAVAFARKEKEELEKFLLSLSEFAKPKIKLEPEGKKLSRIIKVRYEKDIRKLLEIHCKIERNLAFKVLEKKVVNELIEDDFLLSKNEIVKVFFDIKKKSMRDKIFETGLRIDGRKIDELRAIDSMMNIPFMNSSHGSAIFSRGKTKALVSVVFGTTYDEQVVEGFESDKKERFILHYSFPPYSTGEASQIKTPSRREVGHGKLAFKALRSCIPEKHAFPYTIRVSSEILSCDGSSSMATICGGMLAMIDAGVPVKDCVAGLAIGVVVKQNSDCDQKDILLLSDLIGDEDHLGDMDFKYAGSVKGVTALQMDVKEFGIKNDEVFSQILERGASGLKTVLNAMQREIDVQKDIVKQNAPLISQISVDKSQAKIIIGNRGDTIKTIAEMSGARIDVDSGSNIVSIFANNRNSINKAREIIEDLILQAEVGKTYNGVVEKITDFGIFIKFMNDKMRGLIHEKNCESDMYEFYNLKKSLKVGDSLKVKVMFISSDGKIGLSPVIDSESNFDSKINNNGGENNGGNDLSGKGGVDSKSDIEAKSFAKNDASDIALSPGINQESSIDDNKRKEKNEINEERRHRKPSNKGNSNDITEMGDDFLNMLNDSNEKSNYQEKNQYQKNKVIEESVESNEHVSDNSSGSKKHSSYTSVFF